MQLFYCSDPQAGILSPAESFHCTKVLRKTTGDEIDITDGRGRLLKCKLLTADAKNCRFEILSWSEGPKPSHSIHIAIAPAKNAERNDWFIEKAVELGIDRITFLLSRYSERSKINLERAEKKAVSAMKQSLRATLPRIDGVVKFHDFLMKTEAGEKFLAHLSNEKTPYLKDAATPSRHYVVLIGPEGGFSEEEIGEAGAAGFQNVKLGDHRLRTETAGLAACLTLNLINQT